jgi:hypothetical protein
VEKTAKFNTGAGTCSDHLSPVERIAFQAAAFVESLCSGLPLSPDCTHLKQSDLPNRNLRSRKAYGCLYFADPARTSSPPLTRILSTEQHWNPSGSVMLTGNVAHAVR